MTFICEFIHNKIVGLFKNWAIFGKHFKEKKLCWISLKLY